MVSTKTFMGRLSSVFGPRIWRTGSVVFCGSRKHSDRRLHEFSAGGARLEPRLGNRYRSDATRQLSLHVGRLFLARLGEVVRVVVGNENFIVLGIDKDAVGVC